MRDLFDRMTRPMVVVLAILSSIGALLAAASMVVILYVGHYFLHDPKLAVDGANDVPILIYVAAPALLALTICAALFARLSWHSLRRTAA
jgi:hypothetical protein